MGTAINRLMETELAARITQGDALAYTPAHQHYYELSGTAQLRQALAGFFTRHFCSGRNVSPDNVSHEKKYIYILPSMASHSLAKYGLLC